MVTPYIAEFWNTVTSLLMCVAASYAFYWKWKHGVERRFLVAEVAIWIVGFGSALFHGTLTFYGQLADELPMLYGAFVWVYIILHQTKKKGVVDRFVVTGVSVLAIGWTLVSSVIHFNFNWVFEVNNSLCLDPPYYIDMSNNFKVVFGIIMLGCMWIFFRLTLKSKSPYAMKIFYAYVLLNLASFLLWNLDQMYCHQLKSLYGTLPFTSLHGFWHLGMSAAMYLATLLIVMLRVEHLSGKPAKPIWYAGSVLPLSIEPHNHKNLD